MEEKEEDIFITKCRTRIEDRLAWGSGASWTNADFEKLSEKIFDTTQISLSTATLKRLWGRVKYDNVPTITTLNTLAKFLGHEGWRDFVESEKKITATPIRSIAGPPAGSVKVRQYRSLWIAAFITLALVVSGFFLVRREKKENVDPLQYSFSSEKVVMEGVPNSVVFNYDASAAPTDSVYIQQSWDARRSKKVSREGRQHTSIYHSPGAYQAKLIVGTQVVKEHNILITTKGWVSNIEQEPPYYFPQADFMQKGELSLPIEKIKSTGVSFQPEVPWITYGNVRDFGDIRTDNFTFETTLKSTYNEGGASCQHVRVKLLTEAMPIIIPLSIKGCISDLNILFGDDEVDGKKNDLSAFGCDVGKWVKLKCSVNNGHGEIYINDTLAFHDDFKGGTRIVGIVFQFQGTGAVSEVSLAGASGAVVYRDRFEM